MTAPPSVTSWPAILARLDEDPQLPVPARDAVPVPLAARDLRPLGDAGGAADGIPATGVGVGRRIDRLFVATVVVPVIAAAVGLFLFASDRYGSEARFVLRSAGRPAMAMEGGGGLPVGLSRSGEDAYIVEDYIVSRDAFGLIEANPALRDILARPEADLFNRFPAILAPPTREELYDRYRAAVRTSVDGTTGISTIGVTAFRPQDARALARALLGSAETVVNRLNLRADGDRVAFATEILDRAKDTVAEVERRLTSFRSASGTVDPMREYASALQNIGRLSIEASQREAALDQQVALTPNGPGIASLREKVRAYREEIDRQNRQIAGGDGSLAIKMEAYESLTLEREIATKALVSAQIDLETTRKEAGQQHLYLQAMVEPNLPDVPDGPRRSLILGAVLLSSLALYATIRQLKGLAEEHAG